MFNSNGSVVAAKNLTVIKTGTGRYRITLNPTIVSGSIPFVLVGESTSLIGNGVTGNFAFNINPSFFEIGTHYRYAEGYHYYWNWWYYWWGGRLSRIEEVSGNADASYPIGVLVL